MPILNVLDSVFYSISCDVVSKFRPDCDADFILHVDEVFNEYRVKHVRQSEIDQFANLVDTEAHA